MADVRMVQFVRTPERSGTDTMLNSAKTFRHAEQSTVRRQRGNWSLPNISCSEHSSTLSLEGVDDEIVCVVAMLQTRGQDMNKINKNKFGFTCSLGGFVCS
eukprot:2608744-Amphidinium_carterae.1